jgi:putative SOS response-associated peptidase YedK
MSNLYSLTKGQSAIRRPGAAYAARRARRPRAITNSYGILTTEANAVVAPIHPKAMPVILTTPEEADHWLEWDTPAALALQRPLPDDALHIVAKGEKEDGVIPLL